MSQNMIPRSTTSSNNVCPRCKGTGWIQYESDEGTEEIYGNLVMLSYAKKCDCNNNEMINPDRTELPQNYRDCKIDQFDFDAYSADTEDFKTVAMSFFNNYKEWKAASKGLYLWSKTPGSGKTFLSACLAKSVMYRTQKLVKYITPVNYIDKVAQGYKDRNLVDPSLIYRTCELLILDDLGAQMDIKNKDWYAQELFRLIDTRSSNGLCTIFTSNMNIEHLNVDDRLKSRIMKSSIIVHMPEESIRNKLANEEQSNFINHVLGG